MYKTIRPKLKIQGILFTLDSIEECLSFIDNYDAFNEKENSIQFYNSLGNHIAELGDWIIKGFYDECFICKPNEFYSKYEIVEAQ